jgi:hypothetical protein
VTSVHLLVPVADRLVPACGARSDEPSLRTALSMCEACQSVVRARLATLARELECSDRNTAAR